MARTVAGIALCLALVVLGGAAMQPYSARNGCGIREVGAWILMLCGANMVLGVAVLWRRLQRRLDVLRMVGAAFPLCWAAAMVVAGERIQEDAWQTAIRFAGSALLALLGMAVALGFRWGIRFAQTIAWWQVLFHFGTTVAIVVGVPLGGANFGAALLVTTLQLSAFALLLHIFSLVESAISSDTSRVDAHRPRAFLPALSFWGALIVLVFGWVLDWSHAPWLIVVAGSAGSVLGFAWIARRGDALPGVACARCIELPRIPLLTTTGRLLVFIPLVLGAGVVLFPLAAAMSLGNGRGVLGVLPVVIGIGVPMLAIAIGVSLIREFVRSRTDRVVADETGFRITVGRESQYVLFVDCEWGEIRRTFWGAELVLRTSGFNQLVAYPLLDLPSVLCAARALRRCTNMRARSRKDTPAAFRGLSRPHGASLGPWIRSIQDLVRGPAHPYQGRAPTPDALLCILDDVRSSVCDRAGAAVALLAMHQDAEVRRRLVEGGSPPLVVAAAALAGAEVPMHAFDDAIRYLEDEDRVQAREMRQRPGR